MMAMEFWQTASEELKRELVTRSGYDDAADEQNVYDLPFWNLPNAVKAAVYESREFRLS